MLHEQGLGCQRQRGVSEALQKRFNSRDELREIRHLFASQHTQEQIQSLQVISRSFALVGTTRRYVPGFFEQRGHDQRFLAHRQVFSPRMSRANNSVSLSSRSS